MSLGRLVVTAVKELGRSKSEVARDYRVSRRWVHEIVRHYEAEGEAGLEPRSRRPLRSPQQTSVSLEEEIVELRKALSEQGLDAGAHTIAFHLERRHGSAPAPSTIWRVLTRRGFVTPQPQKRPRSSFIRFEADQPNERWQADITHWELLDGSEVEILNIIDDHSRLCVASDARAITKGADVVQSFHTAFAAHGFPASVLTDNAAVFAGGPRGGGRCAIEVELGALGVAHRHSTPYHPQTCGKVERFHQTEKKWLAKHPKAKDIEVLQELIDRFRSYYNAERPHRGPSSADAAGGVRGETEGHTVACGVRRSGALPGAQGPRGHCGEDHAALQEPAASHRPGPSTRTAEGPRPCRGSPRQGPHRGRRAASRSHDRSDPELPGAGMNMEGCPETRVHDVSRHHRKWRWGCASSPDSGQMCRSIVDT